MKKRANFSAFYKRSIEDRSQIVKHWMGEEFKESELALKNDLANQLIENYLFNYELPLGLAVNFKVNNKAYVIPMATEEPSVIAAASNGAKILGNISSKTSSRELTGQIVFKTKQAFDKIEEIILDNKGNLLKLAKEASDSMVRRGGGPVDIWLDKFQQSNQHFITVYLSFDPCDAMGANALNTVLETLTPVIESLISETATISILSNYQPDSITSATVSLEIDSLDKDYEKAKIIAQKIVDASLYASLDPYRAATHNKGIMNGIDALIIATGNDWRAVEAGAHAYAVKKGQYRALSEWTLSDDEQFLIGRLDIPLQLATVGGTLSSHPKASWALRLLEVKSAEELANITAAVGLVQNFAAIRALVTDGIQKGHMRMQARALALQAGAEIAEVDALVQKLIQLPRMSQSVAKEILISIRNQAKGD